MNERVVAADFLFANQSYYYYQSSVCLLKGCDLIMYPHLIFPLLRFVLSYDAAIVVKVSEALTTTLMIVGNAKSPPSRPPTSLPKPILPAM